MTWISRLFDRGSEQNAAQCRKFGIVMAGAAGILSFSAWRRGSPALPWAAAAAGVFLAAALLVPRVLAPLEHAWMTLAEKISVVMTAVILTLTFYLLITPLGLLRRLIVRDDFGREFDHGKSTYWTPVDPDDSTARTDKPY